MLKPNFRPEPRVLHQFAVFAVVGLPLLAGLLLRLFHAYSWTHPALLAAAAVGVLQLVLYQARVTAPSRWLYVTLTIVALPIGFVLSQVLMALIYYLVITPIGLVFRAIGRDAMGRKLDAKCASYWHDRGPARKPSTYFRLY
jgi:hypothetical protein